MATSTRLPGKNVKYNAATDEYIYVGDPVEEPLEPLKDEVRYYINQYILKEIQTTREPKFLGEYQGEKIYICMFNDSEL